ncbi:MAG TPA: Clp protease N-terminal domain-containing protein [Streptosporangiaceae bacterium]
MTAKRQPKRAIRSRMERTGEKYTQARRALLASGGSAGDDPGVTIRWPQDSLGWFDDQACNAILLADDEARMLSHPRVDPEHLLLAAARRGNVERLLAGQGIDARAIHDVITAIKGFGGKLQLRPRRSPASEQVLRRAVTVAAARGVLGPGTEHLLLALGEHEVPARILAELGVQSAQALVDAGQGLPPIRPPVDPALLERRAAQLAAHGMEPPSPGPIPPIFERFTGQARAAINAAVEHARRANDRWVEPPHLLFGALNARTGVAAAVRTRYGWHRPPAQPRYPGDTGRYRPDPEHDNVFICTQPPHLRATGIFTSEARRIVAEDMLIIAERLDHRALTTGHVFLAILERYAYLTIDFINALPPIREITAEVTDALPGQEDT